MLKICLLVLPWMAETAMPVESAIPTGISAATCVRPVASVVDVPAHRAIISGRTVTTSTADEWLLCWEIASRRSPDQNRSQRENFRRLVREQFNEHVVDTADRLTGRIDSEQLREAYRWQVIDSNSDCVRLAAIPQDDIDRLFVGTVYVRISSRSGDLTELTVAGRDRQPQLIWRSVRQSAGEIELAHFEDSVPPAPVVLLRTADVRTER